MQVVRTKPPIVFHLLIAFSLLVGVFALISEWLEPKPELKPFTLELKNPLYSMPDYGDITHIPTRKEIFFKTLLPLALYENTRITWQREQLKAARRLVEKNEPLGKNDLATITEIARYYRMEWPLTDQQWRVLDNRVYPVPLDLVLMQAANESAWGTSRFAKKGNNLFGQWCFTKGCGLVPAARDDGKGHEVRKFATILESVQSYMNNINTHRAYRDLRNIREKLYESGKKVGGVDLAPGLLSYSERGQAYVDELISMINSNSKYVNQAMQEVGGPFLNQ